MDEKSALEQAYEIIKLGGVVVCPTETSYAIGCDATNARAVERVFAIKGREAGKTPPLIVANLEMARTYAILSPQLEELARTYWPGALTIVALAISSTRLAPQVIALDGTIALRVSSHEIPRGLSWSMAVPLVATSANRAGMPACFSVLDVRAQFADQMLQPDLYIDGGVLKEMPASTIVSECDGKLIVLRQGALVIPDAYVA